MKTRKKKTGEPTDAASGHRGVRGRHHYEYAPPQSVPQGTMDGARSTHPLRPADAGAKARSVKE
jgi:hypothetical protein